MVDQRFGERAPPHRPGGQDGEAEADRANERRYGGLARSERGRERDAGLARQPGADGERQAIAAYKAESRPDEDQGRGETPGHGEDVAARRGRGARGPGIGGPQTGK